MKKEYTYRLDKRTKRLTLIITLLVALVIAFFIHYSRSGYFPIWFAFFVVTALALYILSIPRKIKVDKDAFKIQCLVELTSIDVGDIASIRRMEPREMKFSLPTLAGYGFFGYYGYYYNFSEMQKFKVYASQWKNFVRIEDIYEDVYVVNCDEADDLIETVLRVRQEKLRDHELADNTRSNT